MEFEFEFCDFQVPISMSSLGTDGLLFAVYHGPSVALAETESVAELAPPGPPGALVDRELLSLDVALRTQDSVISLASTLSFARCTTLL